jgi:hypothetical protein
MSMPRTQRLVIRDIISSLKGTIFHMNRTAKMLEKYDHQEKANEFYGAVKIAEENKQYFEEMNRGQP